MGLKAEIDSRRATIHTDGYSMSVGELLNLYRDGELDIHPEFQRFFRWSDVQKTRLIESLLLGIPIPSIFVSQREDGVWDVIDGLQRLSTIFQLIGVLVDENGEHVQPLVLGATRYLPSLAGKIWDDDFKSENSLDREQQLIVKRTKIDVKIILRESDETSKFELFQRLNTGGSPLSDQELRNCILITVNRSFYNWMIELATDEHFRNCIALTERLYDEQYDLELVLRFLVLRRLPNDQLRTIGDIGEFLTDAMVQMAQSPEFDRRLEEEAFRFTFEQLSQSLADDSFRRYDPMKDRFLGGFLISAYEIISLGIGWNYQRNLDVLKHLDIVERVKQIWRNPEYINRIGSGVRASSRIPFIIPLGREVFGREVKNAE